MSIRKKKKYVHKKKVGIGPILRNAFVMTSIA